MNDKEISMIKDFLNCVGAVLVFWAVVVAGSHVFTWLAECIANIIKAFI